MKTMNQIVGDNLRKIRDLAGFNQDQVAASVGIERTTYGNYERGIREIPFDTLENIANLFGCETYVFFEDSLQANNEMLAAAFRVSDLEEEDLKEVAAFKDIVKSYLKMERIAENASH